MKWENEGKTLDNLRERIKNKKRIVVKIGSSSIIHEETGHLNFQRMERLVRILTDIHNSGKDVVLVSSGAVGVGMKALGLMKKPRSLTMRQACAAVGQGRLIAVYQKLFSEYNQGSAQVLLTKETMLNEIRRLNAKNTFENLFDLDMIPVVNENDTVSTEELEFGDNDTLSAVVAAVVGADLLILLSDIDGMYTDDPGKNKDAELIPVIEVIDEKVESMGKGSNSSVGTGGMVTKIAAANIVTDAGADMIITNANDLNNLSRIFRGEEVGTLFLAHKRTNFKLLEYLEEKPYFTQR
ncbi:MAG: glutamate 5-kinase [Lachnospiraceae bacterium]|nr:glutamate 5-kinase [Lachnospiraceae bacterium]